MFGTVSLETLQSLKTKFGLASIASVWVAVVAVLFVCADAPYTPIEGLDIPPDPITDLAVLTVAISIAAGFISCVGYVSIAAWTCWRLYQTRRVV